MWLPFLDPPRDGGGRAGEETQQARRSRAPGEVDTLRRSHWIKLRKELSQSPRATFRLSEAPDSLNEKGHGQTHSDDRIGESTVLTSEAPKLTY